MSSRVTATLHRVKIFISGWRSVLLLVLALAPPAAHAQSVYIEDLTWPEIRDAIAAGKKTAIIYAGSTEQKGPHMATGQHNVVARFAAGRIAETLGDALVYPTLPFARTGDPVAKTGHMRFPGSVSLSADVFAGVIRDIAVSALSAGFREVYLMGDHGGGQAELKIAAERLDAEGRAKGAFVRYVPDLYYKSQELARKHLAANRIMIGTHADAVDTSELMFLDSGRKWIRPDRMAASSAAQQPATGVEGDPTKASAEMGKVFLGYKIDAAVAQIRAFRESRR